MLTLQSSAHFEIWWLIFEELVAYLNMWWLIGFSIFLGPQVEVPLSFYRITKWSCSAPESLWDMPESNQSSLLQMSGALPMSHLISRIWNRPPYWGVKMWILLQEKGGDSTKQIALPTTCFFISLSLFIVFSFWFSFSYAYKLFN